MPVRESSLQSAINLEEAVEGQGLITAIKNVNTNMPAIGKVAAIDLDKLYVDIELVSGLIGIVEEFATDAEGSAGEAENSAANAAVSENNAHNSELSALDAAAQAVTASSLASTSESNAAASELAASTSASSASTSEANAASSEAVVILNATSATDSASSAFNSASNAATSAGEALTSETNAQATLETLYGIFLGVQASDPTVDLNGNPLDGGEWYYNSNTATTRIYVVGTGWVNGAVDTTSLVFLDSDATLDSLQLNGGTGDRGTLSWNNSDRTLNLEQGGVSLQLGQEMHMMVRNATGSTIGNGTFLGFTGVTVGSNRVMVGPFDPSTMDAHALVGFATENISNGINGFATSFGYVRELDTRGTSVSNMAVGDEDWSVGDLLYPHPSVAGKLTNVAPTSGFKASVGVVTNRHATEGEIFVRVTALDENAYATAAQGALADSAIQAGDNVSTLVNDANYATTSYVDTNKVDKLDRNYVEYKPSIKPILDLDFANQEYSEYEAPTGKTSKPLADVLDVTNGSATYIDPTGMIRTADANTARLTYNAETGVSEGLLVEESRTNLLTYPNDFTSSAWQVGGGAISVIPNYSKAVDGSFTATLLEDNADSNYGYVNQVASQAFSVGDYTGSIFIKYKSAITCRINVQLYGTTTIASTSTITFDTNGNIISIIGTGTLRYEYYGDGWYRVIQTVNNTDPSNGYARLLVWPTGTVSADTGGLLVSHAQLEQGSFPTSIIPDATIFNSRASTGTYYDSTGTLQTAAVNVARYSYNPANLKAEPVLLLEEARTNLLTYSTTLTVAWSGSSATVTPNSGTSPDGTNNTLKITSTSATGVVYSDKSMINGEPYTLSVYVKKGTSNNARVRFTNMVSGAVNCDINFSAGTPTISLGSITYVGNDWYRVSISDISANTATRVGLYGDMVGTGHTLFYAPQLEQGSYPTSYIPTTTSAVTRAADVSTGVQAVRLADNVTRDLSTLDGWTGREGTLYGEYRFTSTSQFGSINNAIKLSDGTNDNLIQLWNWDGADSINLYITQNGVNISNRSFTSSSGISETEFNKVVISWKGSVAVFSVAGQSQSFTMTEEFKALLSELEIGGNGEAILTKNVKLFPRTFSEAEAIALTS